MRICHFSDWRGHLVKVPKADVYICTGSMLPMLRNDQGELAPEHAQVHFQGQYIREHRDGRTFLGDKDAPIIMVRGRHDFTSPASLFSGRTYEISHNDTTTLGGVIFGGFRGSYRSKKNDWKDELTRGEAANRVSKLSLNIDVLVTHSPPRGVRDSYTLKNITYKYGIHDLHERNLQTLAKAANDIPYPRPTRLHCFGMLLGARGFERKPYSPKPDLDVCYSNAAGGWIVLDRTKNKGWTVVNTGTVLKAMA